MESLYGFKEKDVLLLAEFLKSRKNQPLTEVFKAYALMSGKKEGTIRNLYYAMAKKSGESEEFRKKYLGGKRMKVNEIKNFSKEETEEIMKKILLKKNEGKSIRKAVGELSKGNIKLALRYQNKYRAALFDEGLIKKLKSQGFDIDKEVNAKNGKKRGGGENNYSVSLSFFKKENALLKKELARLKIQNDRLNYRLSGKEKSDKNL